jgi:hypothetical protein
MEDGFPSKPGNSSISGETQAEYNFTFNDGFPSQLFRPTSLPERLESRLDERLRLDGKLILIKFVPEE